MTPTDVHSLVGAYVLDAVDDLERAAFERHVGGCASCRAELDELRETASRMADSTWSIPPPRLRSDVMAAIHRTRQLPPHDAGPAPRAAGRSRLSRWAVASAAAVVLAAGTGATVWAVQEQRVRDQGAVAAAAQQEAARTQAILASPDVIVRSSAMTGGGRVTVASSATHDASVVLLGADTAPRAGQAFQFWAQHGTEMVDAGVLTAGASTAVRIVEHLPGSDGFGVTLEPAGGSREPTLPPVALISFV